MNQEFVYRVIGDIRGLELTATHGAPESVVSGATPLEHDLNLLAGRNQRCNLGRNGDPAIRR